jgi:hypothetical protein
MDGVQALWQVADTGVCHYTANPLPIAVIFRRKI